MDLSLHILVYCVCVFVCVRVHMCVCVSALVYHSVCEEVRGFRIQD